MKDVCEFKYNSFITKSEDLGEDGKFIIVPISSTNEDSGGDVMSQKAIDSMTHQLKSGRIAMYHQHGIDEHGNPMYSWEDQLAKWTDAKQEGDILYAKAKINEYNEKGMKLWNYIANAKQPIGFSIGGYAKRKQFTKDIAGKAISRGNIIDDILLLEVSAVGMPMNRDATCSDETMVEMNDDITEAITKAFKVDDMMDDFKEKYEELLERFEEVQKERDTLSERLDAVEQKQYADAIDALNKRIEVLEAGHTRESTVVVEEVGKDAKKKWNVI
jgi:methyl-accepting chemotaxis protein